MLPIFKDYLFQRLPKFFKIEDTFKDINNEGLLERYLRNFGEEVDDEISDQIDNFLDQIQPLLADEKFLDLIAYTIGNPPDLFNDNDKYRTLLANVMAVYKVKGTVLSYEILFALLGFIIVLTEYPPISIFYDDSHTYDEGGDVTYDQFCHPCSDYDIAFSDPSGGPVGDTTIAILRRIIFFVEPINARLRALIGMIAVDEIADYCGQDNVSLTNINLLLYDNSETYDASSTYDEETVGLPTDIVNQCTGTLEGVDYWIIETDFEVQ